MSTCDRPHMRRISSILSFKERNLGMRFPEPVAGGEVARQALCQDLDVLGTCKCPPCIPVWRQQAEITADLQAKDENNEGGKSKLLQNLYSNWAGTCEEQ